MPYEVRVIISNNGGTKKRIVDTKEQLESFIADVSTRNIRWEEKGVIDIIPFHSVQKITYTELE